MLQSFSVQLVNIERTMNSSTKALRPKSMHLQNNYLLILGDRDPSYQEKDKNTA